MTLRGKLVLAFALVALAAVGLTATMTYFAAQQAQSRLTELFMRQMQTLPNGPGTAALRAHLDSGVMGGMGGDAADMTAIFGAPGQAITEELQLGILLAVLTAGLLAIAVGMLLSRHLSAPYVRLIQGVRRLASGERGVQIAAAQAEVGELITAFNALSTALERQETLRRNLVADVAHDLRTPVAVLQSKLEAIQDGLVPLDQRTVSTLHGEVLLLGRLVEDLRTLSLAEAGGLDLDLEQTLLRPLLERSMAGFVTLAEAAGVQMTLDPVDPALTVNVDKDRFVQVLNNLLDNAMRHAGPCTLELSARCADGDIQIFVRDTGPGLSPQTLDRMFERFYRADTARSRRAGGSGLGLSIARVLINLQGGRLEAANHPQGGAIFIVSLLPPCRLKQTKLTPPTTPLTSGAASSRCATREQVRCCAGEEIPARHGSGQASSPHGRCPD